MAASNVISFAHVAVCVSDLEISRKFYTEALGFKFDHSVAAGEPFGKLVELPDFKYRADFYTREGVVLELLSIDSPGYVGEKTRRPINKLGITHLSFIIDDMDAVVNKIVELGGHKYPETLVESPYGEIMFCTDPDGIRIELWRKAG